MTCTHCGAEISFNQITGCWEDHDDMVDKDALKICESSGNSPARHEPARVGFETVERLDALSAVIAERARQDGIWGWPNEGMAGADRNYKYTILAEEVGEVARAVLEKDDVNLKEELIQVMAVCLAWLEGPTP